MSIAILFFFSFIFSISTLASGLDETSIDMAAPDKRALMIQGQLTSVRIVPADKTAKLYVLGKKVVEGKPTHELRPRIVRVTAFNKDSEEELKLTPEGDYYVVENPKFKNPYSLRIDTQYDKQKEKLELKVP